MGKFRSGVTYRYARPYSDHQDIKDGLPNYFARVTSSKALPLLESGVSPIGICRAIDGVRTPAILISTSPHKTGSDQTPWQDDINADRGYARYFGDNKGARNPALAPGNKILLEQFQLHNSGESNSRLLAAPIIIFERVRIGGRAKGNLRFAGYGLIRSAELVTQFQKSIGYFTNYVFEFSIMDLSDSREEFDWAWVNARRDSTYNLKKCAEVAPTAWQEWISKGEEAVERNRRRVSKNSVIDVLSQKPVQGSREDKCLREIYEFYSASKKHKFELLASRVTQGIVSHSGASYREGWITPGSGDGGVDFVGRVDIGTGFASTKLIVLGQAKCEKLTVGTSGKDVARTVSRLKRGWIGSYVTTSFFTTQVQQEIIEDQFPLITINGLDLARETLKLVEQSGFSSVLELLSQLESEYKSLIQKRRPEDILLD
jgi:hypothetical protein